MQVSLFGRMRLLDGAGKPVDLRSRKARAVIAVLAVAAPAPVLRQHLIDLLWSRRDSLQGRGSLRQCIHELNLALGPLGGDLLRADRNHAALRREAIRIDIGRSDSGGNFLEDLVGLDPAFDRWLETQRQRMDRAAVVLAEAELLRLLPAETDPAAAIAAAERVLAIEPTHEGAWRAVMAAHAARGEHAAAIGAYQRCATTLAEVAQTAPSAETEALAAWIRRPASAAPEPPAPAVTASRAAAPRMARLGVMPFRAAPPSEDPLALGLAEEITNALARFRWFFLVASPSLAALAGQARKSRKDWKSLGLDFVLDGTVQRSRGRVRVLVRLLDLAADGEIAWAGRFDRANADILTLQDEIAAEVVARIDPELLQREGRRAAARPPSNTTAYDLVLRSIPAIHRLERTSFLAAGAALERAVALDAGYAGAQAWWACWHVFLVGQNWASDPAQAMARAGSLAERAIQLDPADARGLTIAGHVTAFLHHRVDEAIALHERALALNPNLPLAWALSGLAQCYAGRHDEAIRRIRQARQLSPLDPQGFFFEMALMLPHLLRGEYEAVLTIGRHAIGLNPALTSTYKLLLAALGQLGRLEEAAPLRAQLLAMAPGLRLADAVARTAPLRPEDMQIYENGLRLAGLPD
ncbi:MAG: hypothetical protein KGL55_10185 [Rhodospirillales bacterium]|nr:hypothetical protein [Rhodospirillales bacterium]